jgi:hypothetical protein
MPNASFLSIFLRGLGAMNVKWKSIPQLRSGHEDGIWNLYPDR